MFKLDIKRLDYLNKDCYNPLYEILRVNLSNKA